MMHWASILFALLLAGLSAGLVFLAGWSGPWALMLVAIGGFAFVFVLLGIVLMLAPAEARWTVLAEFWRTFWRDVMEIRKWMKGRDRP